MAGGRIVLSQGRSVASAVRSMKAAAAVATLIAAAALALVVAYWGWQIFGPAPLRIAPGGPANPAATLIAADLFGAANRSEVTVTSSDSVLTGDTRLLGIIAEHGRGYALFRLPSGARLVAQGQEISKGATLVSVQPDAVTIRDGSGERRFVLRESDAAARRDTSPASRPSPSRTGDAATARAARAATCGPPAGFRGTVVRLNTELLGGLGADSVQWRNVLAAVSGGLVVRADNGFAAMLGLKPGDRLTQANGVALTVPEDVGNAIVRPLAANQGVRLTGSRDGTTQELWLANVACAG